MFYDKSNLIYCNILQNYEGKMLIALDLCQIDSEAVLLIKKGSSEYVSSSLTELQLRIHLKKKKQKKN